MDSQTILIFVIFLSFIIILFLARKAGMSFFRIYKKKKDPDYPMVPGEYLSYLGRDINHFFKFFITPLFWWKIIFRKYSDKELNIAARKARSFILLFYELVIFYF